MLTENRKYDYSGLITLNKSHVLSPISHPQNDTVNWLFLHVEERLLSFVYRIINPLETEYGKPFEIEMAFTASEIALEILQLEHIYQVLRGQEGIGIVELTHRYQTLD